MPVLTTDRLPKYRKHKASGQAIVTLNLVSRDFPKKGSPARSIFGKDVSSRWAVLVIGLGLKGPMIIELGERATSLRTN